MNFRKDDMPKPIRKCKLPKRFNIEQIGIPFLKDTGSFIDIRSKMKDKRLLYCTECKREFSVIEDTQGLCLVIAKDKKTGKILKNKVICVPCGNKIARENHPGIKIIRR